jgi:hypothetical protein
MGCYRHYRQELLQARYIRGLKPRLPVHDVFEREKRPEAGKFSDVRLEDINPRKEGAGVYFRHMGRP